jgi:structural maintenance of chromosome 3 (chondroitin sulfate proteoglycan 6)
MDRNTARGLKSVCEIVDRMKIKGYHGPLYELFTVEQRYQTAVEVVAAGSMFHIVVDSDETASKILKALNDQKGGRVTFMPLNRLKTFNQSYPDTNAIPMIKKLEYLPEFELAMMQVFGKAIITNNLEQGSIYARQYNITAVTIGGDRADRKGALSGGFHDIKHSRIDSVNTKIIAFQKKGEVETTLSETKLEIIALDRDILAIRDEMTKVEAKKRQLVSNRDPLNDQLKSLLNQQSNLEGVCGRFAKSVETAKENIAAVETEIEANNSELRSAFQKKLSDDEHDRLEYLSRNVVEMKSMLADIVKERSEIEVKKNVLEIEIGSNLVLRRDQIKEKIDEVKEAENVNENIGTQQQDISELDGKIQTSTERFAGYYFIFILEIGGILEETAGGIFEFQQTLERAKQELSNIMRINEKRQRLMDKFMTKKSVIMQKKENALNHIRDLGVLPDEAFEKYEDSSEQTVFLM